MVMYGKLFGEQTKPAQSTESHNGKCFYLCPWCDKKFEYWDTRYSKRFKRESDGVYRHNECGKLLTID